MQTVVLCGPAQRLNAKLLIDRAPMDAVLTIGNLRRLLRYDPQTGRLYWLPRTEEMFCIGKRRQSSSCSTWNSRYAGREAFTTKDNHGYRQGALYAKLFKAHRVAFALHNGRWPVGEIDHADGDPANNAAFNLRECDRSGNCRNRLGNKTRRSSKYKGVSWCSKRRKWKAQCKALGYKQYIGIFDSEIEAAHAYDLAARERHGQFAKANFT